MRKKIVVQLVIYNNRSTLEPVLHGLFAQSFSDFEVVAVICGSNDGSLELLIEKFPQIRIINPGQNLGFSGGHNLALEQANSELVFLLNPDLIMTPDYLKNLIQVFENPKIASASGKLFQMNINTGEKKLTLDSTGIVMYASGRSRDRGQHEKDNTQYDSLHFVPAVSGAGPMYRRASLDLLKQQQGEIFDQDYFMYWEDVDLGLRLLHAGFINWFEPSAVAYHGRGSGSSQKGVWHPFSFLKHRQTISQFTRELNWKNHFFTIIKNYPKLSGIFWLREFLMLCFILCFEIKTLRVFPEFCRQFSKMWRKRRIIQKTSRISRQDFEKYFAKIDNKII